MRINAKDEKTFKATALALNAAKQSVKTSKQHMTALSMGCLLYTSPSPRDTR